MSALRLVLALTVFFALVVGCAANDAPPANPDPDGPATPTSSTTSPSTSTTAPTTTAPTTTAPTTTTVPVRHFEFDFAFESGHEGWTVGFADLPVDFDQSIYELNFAHRALPPGLEGSGMYVQGHNRSDDLFMFLKRQIDGLEPSASYAVSASIDLATNVPLASVGIGGSPGESVFVKAGASTVEPLTYLDASDHLRMNIDKANQSNSGSQMRVIGNVANPYVVADEYRVKNLASPPGFLSVAADSEGRAWLIVGTDSGFEGLTRLYYDRISFTLTHSDPP